MLPRLVLALACCILLAQAAHAGRLTLVCNAVEDHSGEQMRRTLTIDPDRRVVRDNELTFTDRAPSVFAADLEEFVEIAHPAYPGATAARTARPAPACSPSISPPANTS